MAKVKPISTSRDQADEGDDDDSVPPRTRRQSRKTLVIEHDLSTEQKENSKMPGSAASSDTSSILSSPPPDEEETLNKARGRRRKSDSTGIPRPKRVYKKRSSLINAEEARRRGGNKRKHDHEYCLTCSHYGRACGGRRDDHEGCAVCREPNRQKGEKLRECLWADHDAGIFTYLQAREVQKRAQAEQRAAKGKPPTKRQLPFLTESEKKKYLEAPDPLGIVERSSYSTQPPPVKRPLDLLPPPSAHGQRQMPLPDDMNAFARVHMDSSAESEIHEAGTRQETHQRSRSEGQALKSPSLKLFVKQGYGMGKGHPPPSKSIMKEIPPPTPNCQPVDAQGHRVPYYNPELNAFILPAYPYSNLLPPHMQGKFKRQAYISPYDAYPCIPIALSNANPPTPPIYHPGPPPPNANYAVSRPVYTTRPLDQSGQPVKKWSKSNVSVKNVNGYPVNTGGWSSFESSSRGNSAKGESVSSSVSGKQSDQHDPAKPDDDSLDVASELSSSMDPSLREPRNSNSQGKSQVAVQAAAAESAEEVSTRTTLKIRSTNKRIRRRSSPTPPITGLKAEYAISEHSGTSEDELVEDTIELQRPNSNTEPRKSAKSVRRTLLKTSRTSGPARSDWQAVNAGNRSRAKAESNTQERGRSTNSSGENGDSDTHMTEA